MPDDLIVHHPPERGTPTRRSVVVYMCCTSCCCLHTAGALLGALIGGLNTPQANPESAPEPQPSTVECSDRRPRVRRVFWTSLTVVLFATGPLLCVWAMNGGLDDGTSSRGGRLPLDVGLLGSFAMHVIFGPLFLIAAWMVSLARLAFLAKPRGNNEEFQGLQKILVYTMFGTAFGLMLMLILLVLVGLGR